MCGGEALGFSEDLSGGGVRWRTRDRDAERIERRDVEHGSEREARRRAVSNGVR